MKKFLRKIPLRTALMAAVTLALVVSAAVFMAVSAADENVSASDVSRSDKPKSSYSRRVTRTEVSASDASEEVSGGDLRAVRGLLVEPDLNAAPENLGDPVITMTTSKTVGDTMNLGISGDNVYVDYGDGTLVENVEEQTVKGGTIKIYGNITGLDCRNNQLTTLDVSNCVTLDSLDCSANQLTTLDVSNNTALRSLECGLNQLTTLDVSNNTALRSLECGLNQLTTLDVTNNTALVELFCDNNQFTTLDLTRNTDLQYLCCSQNQLTSLRLPKNNVLSGVCCDNNKLTEMDLSGLPALNELVCLHNQLTRLDVSKNPCLDSFDCSFNQLTELNLSESVNYTWMFCMDNRLTMPQLFSIIDRFSEYAGYAFQTHVVPSSVKAGESIDLSSEYSVNGTVSEFVWYDADGNEVTPATSEGGVFTFGNDAVGKTLVCRMTNENLPQLNEKLEYFNNDNRLTTTKVKIEPADPEEPEDPTTTATSTTTTTSAAATTTTKATTTATTSANDGKQGHTNYYDLEVIDDEDLDESAQDDIFKAQFAEGVTVGLGGRAVDFRSVKGIHLTVSNIEKDKKKTVLDAIAHYKETFDPDTDNVALYDIDLTDGKHTHMKTVNGVIEICIKYPDNLARRAEDYKYHVYHQKDDGTIEEVWSKATRNGIWILATDFSPYVLTWEEKSAGVANTGESMIPVFVLSVLFVLSLAGGGYVFYRRKKLTAE